MSDLVLCRVCWVRSVGFRVLILCQNFSIGLISFMSSIICWVV